MDTSMQFFESLFSPSFLIALFFLSLPLFTLHGMLSLKFSRIYYQLVWHAWEGDAFQKRTMKPLCTHMGEFLHFGASSLKVTLYITRSTCLVLLCFKIKQLYTTAPGRLVCIGTMLEREWRLSPSSQSGSNPNQPHPNQLHRFYFSWRFQ